MTQWFVYENLTTKTSQGDFQVTTLETPLLSQQVVTSKGISKGIKGLERLEIPWMSLRDEIQEGFDGFWKKLCVLEGGSCGMQKDKMFWKLKFWAFKTVVFCISWVNDSQASHKPTHEMWKCTRHIFVD